MNCNNHKEWLPWYKENPTLLEMEDGYATFIPDFKFLYNEDGDPEWHGAIDINDQRYELVLRYNPNYPNYTERLAPPVLIYIPDDLLSCNIDPDNFEHLFKLIDDSANRKFICFNDGVRINIEQQNKIFTAAYALGVFKPLLAEFLRIKKDVEEERYNRQKEELEINDAAARKRRELREILRRGIGDGVYGLIAHFENKCKAYCDLLPSREFPCTGNISLSSKNSISPRLILNDFSNYITIDDAQDLIIHFYATKGSYYTFDTQCLNIRFNANSLILYYFIKRAGDFFHYVHVGLWPPRGEN